MLHIVLSTDGACSGNPGPGGYCGILQYKGHEKVVCGGTHATTNNRMELTAVIEAIKVLNRRCDVLVETDSHYVCTGIANSREWQDRGWKLRSGKAPANVDLWMELEEARAKYGHQIRYQYIEGHSGHPMNERCDKLAKEQIQLIKGA